MRSLLHLLVLDMRPEEALRLVLMLALSIGAHFAVAFLLWLLPASSLLERPAPPVELAVMAPSLAPWQETWVMSAVASISFTVTT